VRQPIGNLLLIAFIGSVFAACSSSKPVAVDPNLFPNNYKAEILATLTRTLADPTNVRDAFISDPVLTPVGNDQRYSACVRYNARDAGRQYMGSVDRIAYFYGGHLNQLVIATKEQCGNAAFKPFPELEKLCQATKCN